MDSEVVLGPIDAGDQWGRAVRGRLMGSTMVTPAIGDVLTLWSKASGTAPTKTWLRRDDEVRERLPGGEVPLLAEVLLGTFLDTALPGDERQALKQRHAATYDLLRTMRSELAARRAGELSYLAEPDDGPVAAWATSVTPRVDTLPSAVRQGELFGAPNADLLRGAVWAVARYPSDPGATADLLAAVVEHGVETNAGLEPGTEVMLAGKAVNAGIAMLATLPDRAGLASLERLEVSITNGHHRKHIDKALAALSVT